LAPGFFVYGTDCLQLLLVIYKCPEIECAECQEFDQSLKTVHLP